MGGSGCLVHGIEDVENNGEVDEVGPEQGGDDHRISNRRVHIDENDTIANSKSRSTQNSMIKIRNILHAKEI